jgi:hypothetical protein
MGKAGRNEAKRVAANFLNGAAVAVVATGYIGPLMAGASNAWAAVAVILVSAGLHLLAARVVTGIED